MVQWLFMLIKCNAVIHTNSMMTTMVIISTFALTIINVGLERQQQNESTLE